MRALQSCSFLSRTAAILVLAFAVVAPGRALAQGDIEYEVKATFLVRFGLYVDWPPASFASATSSFVICVVGPNPFGDALDKAASGQRVNDHAVVVRYLKTIGRESGCHIAYLGGSAAQDTARMSEALRGSHALTVSDAASNAGTEVGIIQFVIRDNHVRFAIDDAAAAQNGLAISSKLLGLALSVKPRPHS